MSVLFTPARIGPMEIKNRFVRSATNDRMVADDGAVTDEAVDFYRSLARGGVGLIITGHAYVHPLGQGSVRQTAIYDDRFVPGLRRIAEAVHDCGGRAAVQITHAGRQTRPEIIGTTPLAPSAIPYGLQKTVPHELSDEETEQIVEFFAAAAGRVKAAGFDAVQLHGAHGYLIGQFLSPVSNRRTDRWGKDEKGRFRFLSEVLRRVREEVGKDFPVLIKLGMEDFVDDGLKLADGISVSRRLRERGIDAVETSGGFSEGMQNTRRNVLPGKGEAYFRHFASGLKKSVDVPVILVGGLRSLALMEEIVRSGEADFVSLSRPLIREPDLVSSFEKGASEASCISCNRCLLSQKPEIKCLVLEEELRGGSEG
ncbi:MAG: NADH:flavin oxidoreductase [Candidatus Eiseniibacteriota bacterium]|nr:MAG: NADH:flavin oxidoreductase [Candidatus Eisenbacteria bacterium]